MNNNVKVPLEALSHQFRRTQKILSRDMNALSDQVSSPCPVSPTDLLEMQNKVQALIDLVQSSDSLEKVQLVKLESRIRKDRALGQQVSTHDICIYVRAYPGIHRTRRILNLHLMLIS